MTSDILVVDDERDIRVLIADILEDDGYKCRQAANHHEVMEHLKQHRPDLILLDIWLQGSDLDGLEILSEVLKHYPDQPVVMMSGHGTIDTAVQAIKTGAYDFIEKPVKLDRLLHAVNKAIEKSILKRENRELRIRLGPDLEWVGQSATSLQVQQMIQKVANADSRVLIRGPHGVGKEVIARQIHRLSGRKNGPFVVISCAGLSPDRLEAEMFGELVHQPGQAGKSIRIGFLEQAHGGTLFLDEVADLNLETQGKLVRMLQDQTFERLGGHERVKVDVRVLASSSRDLEKMMQDEAFRADLFYRLNVVPLHVPCLADRKEDIPMLCKELMLLCSESAGLKPRPWTPQALAALQSYDWPGNIRQLRNVIEWLLIFIPSSNEPIDVHHLPAEIVNEIPKFLTASFEEDTITLPIKEAREVFERQYIQIQLNRFGGNVSKTAQFIGMERSALHRKLKFLNLLNGTKHDQDQV